MAWFCRIVGVILVIACILLLVEYFQYNKEANLLPSIIGIVIGLLFYIIGDSADSGDGISEKAFKAYKEIGMQELICPKCGEKYLSGIACPNCDHESKMNNGDSKNEGKNKKHDKHKK